jgi:hypothetical protein
VDEWQKSQTPLKLEISCEKLLHAIISWKDFDTRRERYLFRGQLIRIGSPETARPVRDEDKNRRKVGASNPSG